MIEATQHITNKVDNFIPVNVPRASSGTFYAGSHPLVKWKLPIFQHGDITIAIGRTHDGQSPTKYLLQAGHFVYRMGGIPTAKINKEDWLMFRYRLTDEGTEETNWNNTWESEWIEAKCRDKKYSSEDLYELPNGVKAKFPDWRICDVTWPCCGQTERLIYEE